MVICPECGKDVKDAKFCSNCGALLQQKEEKQTVEIEDVDQKEDVNVDVNDSEEKESAEAKKILESFPGVEVSGWRQTRMGAIKYEELEENGHTKL